MKKRIVSFLMALVMTVSLLPVSAFAADGAYNVAEDTAVQQGDDASSVQTTGVSDYNIVLTNSGITSEVYATDTSTHSIELTVREVDDSGNYVPTTKKIDVNKTYILRYKSKTDILIKNECTRGIQIIGRTYTLNKNQELAAAIITTNTAVWAFPTDTEQYFSMEGAKATKAEVLAAGYTDLDEESSEYYYWYLEYTQGTSKKKVPLQYALLIEITPNGAEPSKTVVDTSKLTALLDTVSDTNAGSHWYTADDRWNGKAASKTGFWAELTAVDGPRAKAQAVLEKLGATQDEIDAAVTDLTAAIANLIPADRANTTLLYEALQSTPVSNDGAYSTKSWAAYKPVRDKAEALMATMFDAKGNPNPINNTNDKNTEIETLAAELKAASKKLDAKGGSGTQAIAKLELEAIQYLTKKYDPNKLSGYTPESMAALRDARTAALKLAAETTVSDVGSNESQALVEALCELRKAIYGLTTTSTAQITVKVSVLDTNDVYRGRGTDADRNKNIYTGVLTLDANASAYETLNSRGLLAAAATRPQPRQWCS